MPPSIFGPPTPQPTGPILNPQFQKMLYQDQWRQVLANVSQALIQAGARGRGTGTGLALGLANANTGRMPTSADYLQMQSLLAREQAAAQERAEKQAEQARLQSEYSKIVGGYDPATGVNWNTGRQGAAQSPLAAGLKPEQTEFLRKVGPKAGLPLLGQRAFPEPQDMSETEKNIAELRARGFSESEAQDIARGRVRISEIDAFNNAHLVNIATGETRVIPLAKPGQPGFPGGGAGPRGVPEAAPSAQALPPATSGPQGLPRQQPTGAAGDENILPPAQTLESAAAGGTGPIRRFASLLDATVGGLFNVQMFPETADNKQHIRLLRQVTKTGLVNNPKFPVAEQQTVEGLMPEPDAFWVNPGAEVNKVVRLRSTLRAWRSRNIKTLASATVTQKKRGDLLDQNAEIDRVLTLMGEGGTVTEKKPRIIRNQQGEMLIEQGDQWVPYTGGR